MYVVRFLFVLVGLQVASPALGGGIIPDRINQIIIQGRFPTPTPGFLVVFSSNRVTDERGRLLTAVPVASLANVKNSQDHVAIKLYGKPASQPGRFDYFFGTLHDAERPWNNGDDFRWEDWEKCSPDIWDYICILALPPEGRARAPMGIITDVTIRKGGKILFDSRARESYPNKRLINVALKPFNITPQRGRHPVLNLADHMARFRTEYYELGSNPILQLAYSDLGQTEKAKYVNRGKNWCSEFTSYVYRQNNIMTPDPNSSDVHWQNMREFFEKHGEVYTLREVAGWSNQKKIAAIKPGAFVSILIGDNTHSLIFTTWIAAGRNPITQYAALSGNNKGMVWSHAPMKLPTADQFQGMTPEQLSEYDQKVFFGVPASNKR